MHIAVHAVDDVVTVFHDGKPMTMVPVADLAAAIVSASPRAPSCDVLPDDVRIWRERGDVVGVAVEVKPHTRTVSWIADGSAANFGRGARYQRYFLAFPYVVLLLVFRGGALTGYQQLYYRRAALEADQNLLLPNLLNVARGYGQHAWVCLANMADVSALSWPAKIREVVDHVFNFKFNRSSEVHEGNSYYGTMKTLDARIASPAAWAAATRDNPRFPLDIAWRSAGTTASAELERMLDQVVTPLALTTATDLGGLVTRAGRRGRRS